MAFRRIPVQPLPGYLGDVALSCGSGYTVLTRCLPSVCLQLTVAFPQYLKLRVHCSACMENEASQHDVNNGLRFRLKRPVKMCIVKIRLQQHSNILLASINVVSFRSCLPLILDQCLLFNILRFDIWHCQYIV